MLLCWVENVVVVLIYVSQQLDLDPLQQERIEILEPGTSSEPFGSFARFMTCAMASFDICYFQDDTWSHHAMDSLYTNMVRFPNLIHAISPPSLYLDQLHWRFSNPGKCLLTSGSS